MNNCLMTKRDLLTLLQELVRSASISNYSSDDHSGCNGWYVVDHERLMSNIEVEIDKLKTEEGE